MGVKCSIDKHVSNLDDVLEISAQYYQKVKFESKIKDEISHHLKVSFHKHLFERSRHYCRYGVFVRTVPSLTLLKPRQSR